jgi:hypothetical protein
MRYDESRLRACTSLAVVFSGAERPKECLQVEVKLTCTIEIDPAEILELF